MDTIKKHCAYTFDVIDTGFDGVGIAIYNGKKVLIKNALIGQKVLSRILKIKDMYIEAEVIEVLERSIYEVDTGFQEHSGMPYSTLPIAFQHDLKIRQVHHLFHSIAHKDISKAFIGLHKSPLDWYYRGKVEYHFGTDYETDSLILGYKKSGYYDRIVSIYKPTGMFDEVLESHLEELCMLLNNYGDAYDSSTERGIYRTLMCRKSFSTGGMMIVLTTANTLPDPAKTVLLDYLKQLLGMRLTSVIIHIMPPNIPLKDTHKEVLYGTNILTEKLCDMQFMLSPESFFQPNPLAAEVLYTRVVELLMHYRSHYNGYIYDIFCGTGTMTQLINKHTKSPVIGIEMSREAVSDARKSTMNNGLHNITYYDMSLESYLKNSLHTTYTADVIVLDPPRSGVSTNALETLLTMQSPLIIYVSCNPATLSRDATIIENNGYTMRQIELVDQFPHTTHIECIAVFTL